MMRIYILIAFIFAFATPAFAQMGPCTYTPSGLEALINSDIKPGVAGGILAVTVNNVMQNQNNCYLNTMTLGTGVLTALSYPLDNPLGLVQATSPTFGGTTEFTGTASLLNLQTPPANILAISAGGATVQNCPLVGCVANAENSTIYMRGSTLLPAPTAEYLFTLDSQSNTGLSPNWQATTPYGAAWVTGHLYPANSYVTHGGNLYVTAIGGTSGATAPTCSGGATPFTNATCSDGTITWVYVSATPTTFYVIGPTTGNLYSTATLGTSGATEPTCGSGTCSDGAITWTYVNNGIVANKVGAFSSWVTGPNTANGTWNWAIDSVWNADNPFMVNVELDVEKIGQLNCSAGVINCYNLYMSGNTDHQITAEIAMSAGTLANPAAYWGMLIAGPYLATVADIEIDDSAPYGLLLNNLYAGTHSTAAIADYSTSPIGFYAAGTYSLAPFYSADGSSGTWGLFLGATVASGSSIASQAAAFSYYNASGVANNMTWTALNNVMYLGSTEASSSLLIPALASGGTQCVQASSTGQLSGTGSACGSGGGGAVGSVSNSDGTLTISPTTGAVVASLALGHANTWTGAITDTAAAPQIILGASGATAGSIALYGNTSTAKITILTAYTGAVAYNASIPALTASDTFAMIGLTQTLSNKTLSSPTFSGTVAGSGTIPLTILATQAANTIVGNAAGGLASPTALPISSCSTAASALQWTTSVGFGCNTSITAAAAPVSGITGLGAGVGAALAINANAASGLPLINSVLPTVGHCLQWGTNGVTDAGGACTTGGGGGTVSSGNAGALAYYASTGTVVSGLADGTSGEFLVENGSNVPAWVTASGDCTLANTGALTCTKTNGTAFGALATETHITQAQGGGVYPATSVGGTANAITVTTQSGTFTNSGSINGAVIFTSTGTNSTAATLAVDGQTALTIYKRTTSGLVATAGGEIGSGMQYVALNNGSGFELIGSVLGVTEFQSGNYTATAIDGNGDSYIFTNSAPTLSLPLSTTVPVSWHIQAYAENGTLTINLVNSSDAINGVVGGTVNLQRYEFANIFTDGNGNYYVTGTSAFVAPDTTNHVAYYQNGGYVAGNSSLTYNPSTPSLEIGTTATRGMLILGGPSIYSTSFITSASATAAATYTLPVAQATAPGQVLTDAAANGVLSWAAGGATLTAGTTATSGFANGSILYSNGSLLENLGVGSTTTVLHGNASGAPSYSAVNLGTDTTGFLPVAVNTQTGTTYSFALSDCGNEITTNNSSGTALSANPVTGGAGCAVAIINLGSSGNTTISYSGVTINGASSLVLTPGQSTTLVWKSSTAWTAQNGSGSGSGAVSSVSNSDGTLTISPTTGSVVASLALGHANTWTATQTYTGTAPQVTLGTVSSVSGTIALANSSSANLVILASGNNAAAWTLTLPTNVPGTAGSLLASTTGGASSWVATIPVANGGTNCSTASITCFNNITGFTASGTTGTTSTNLVFSTSPTFVTPAIGAATGTSLTLSGSTAAGFYANGTYSFSPFESANGASSAYGMVIGATAASDSSIDSQAIIFNYFNASGTLENMGWTALNNVMYLGGTETLQGLLIPALASGATQCVEATTTGLLAGTGSPCGSGGGAVSSVTNSDGTLTISPTTGSVVASIALGHANTWTAAITDTAAAPQIVLGANSGNIGEIKLNGSTSGALLITTQATAGTPTWTAGTSSGTPVVTASAPLSITTATGNITITGAAGQVLAGATPAFTATPTLGVVSSASGSLALANSSSAYLVTIASANNAAAWQLTLPTNVPGTAGSLLASTTGGVTSWLATLPVANGGTNCASASITCFNNITGFSAAGTTGTTSTNLVFSTSPTFVTPVLGAATATSIALGGSTALTANAAAADVQAGTSGALVVTPTALMGSAAPQALAATGFAWNAAIGYNATATLTGNTQVIPNPTNIFNGQTYTLIINPSTYTGYTWGTAFDWGAAGAPTLTASKNNVIACISTATWTSTPTANGLLCTASLGF